MNTNQIATLKNKFDSLANFDETDKIEFWYARELQSLLQYTEWRNFLNVIDKAKIACENSNTQPKHHFVEVNKMVVLGSGAKRNIDDIKLTRYACYLIAQNGDPRKEEIAFAQSYFALQTRKQELIEDYCSKAPGLCLGRSRRPQGKGKPGHSASQTCLPGRRYL